MANPAIKNGYFPIANELAEHFARVNITGQQWRIIWVLLRKTWGFSNEKRRKDWDWISITQFEKYTEMKRSNVYETLKTLLAKRLILKQENRYSFNQNYDEWVLAKRLTVLVKSITPVSQKHNTSVSQLTTHNIKLTKENNTKENIATNVAIEIPNLLNDKNKHIQIIGLYAKAKKITFENKEQQNSFLRRNLRPAQSLSCYGFNRIVNIMKYLIDNADFKWTLETVGKYIDENLTNINGQDEDEKIKSFFDKYKTI
jgi:phage replication O-like protein O